jgi:hypothetical protein
MHFDGEIDNSFGAAFAPSVVNTCHEITEGQRPFAGMGVRSRDLIIFHHTVVTPPEPYLFRMIFARGDSALALALGKRRNGNGLGVVPSGSFWVMRIRGINPDGLNQGSQTLATQF